jgi:hypothetical protein
VSRIVHRFTFRPLVPVEEAEATLQLSLFGAEGLFGAARVRNETGYVVDERSRTFVVDASTEVGQAVVRLFTGYALKEFGQDAFRVERILEEEGAARSGLAPRNGHRRPEGPAPAGVAR